MLPSIWGENLEQLDGNFSPRKTEDLYRTRGIMLMHTGIGLTYVMSSIGGSIGEYSVDQL